MRIVWPTRQQWREEVHAALQSAALRAAAAGVLFVLLLLSYCGQLQVPHERHAERAAATPTSTDAR